jgi:hypothetical protein
MMIMLAVALAVPGYAQEERRERQEREQAERREHEQAEQRQMIHRRMEAEIERRVNEIRQRMEREMRGNHDDRRQEQRLESIGKTLQLHFSVQPDANEIKPISVTTASHWYEARSRMRKEDKQLTLNVGGMIKPVEDGNGMVYQITYDFDLNYEEAGAETEVHVSGSSRVRIGQGVIIGTIADKAIILSLEESKGL